MFTKDQKDLLGAPLDASHVKSRSQAGRNFSYIEGWHAIAEANRIFGFDGWNRETIRLERLYEPKQVDGKWRVGYMATVRITVGEIVRDGCGYGSGISKDLGDAHESAIKEAETDSMKRGLMTFGNPFGLALYDKEKREVTNGTQGRTAAPGPTNSQNGSATPEGPGEGADSSGQADWFDTSGKLLIPVAADGRSDYKLWLQRACKCVERLEPAAVDDFVQAHHGIIDSLRQISEVGHGELMKRVESKRSENILMAG